MNASTRHAYRALDLKPGGPDQVIDLALRRGATIRGRVVGPDGQPVRRCRDLQPGYPGIAPSGRMEELEPRRSHPRRRCRVRDGRFTLHGLDPDGELRPTVLAADSEARRHGPALGPVGDGRAGHRPARAVRLGAARLVDPEGKPLGRYPPADVVWIVVTPGPPYRRNPAKDDPLFANESTVNRIDTVNYPLDFRFDAEGRVTFPALIPGASYRVVDRSPLGGGAPASARSSP